MGFPCGSVVNNLPAMWDTWVRSLGWEDALEKGKATHSGYSGLENFMDCIVHGAAKSQTGLSNFHFQKIALALALTGECLDLRENQ